MTTKDKLIEKLEEYIEHLEYNTKRFDLQNPRHINLRDEIASLKSELAKGVDINTSFFGNSGVKVGEPELLGTNMPDIEKVYISPSGESMMVFTDGKWQQFICKVEEPEENKLPYIISRNLENDIANILERKEPADKDDNAVGFLIRKLKPKSGDIRTGIINTKYAAELMEEYAKSKQINLREELKNFNSWMCGKQYDGRIPLIGTCIDEYLQSKEK